MKKFIAIILSVITILSFAGCGDSTKEKPKGPTAVAIVISTHENAPAVNFNSQFIDEVLSDACYFDRSQIFVVTSEGSPVMTGDYKIPDSEYNISNSNRKKRAEDFKNTILTDQSAITASSCENDTLKAISKAANALRGSDCETKKLLIVDSGIQTSGILNMTDLKVLDNPAEEVLQKLGSFNSIPDLTGINEIKWWGLGCVAGDQKEISNSYKGKLKNLWSAILGSKVEFKGDIEGDEPQSNYTVTPIDFPEDTLFFEEVVLDEGKLPFMADVATLAISTDEAKKVLQSSADKLINHRQVKVLIVGSTASVGNDIQLSLDRANTCKELLVSMGVNSDQIVTAGIGSKDPTGNLRVNDLNSNGLVEELAKKNRAIFILDINSDDAKIILQSQG